LSVCELPFLLAKADTNTEAPTVTVVPPAPAVPIAAIAAPAVVVAPIVSPASVVPPSVIAVVAAVVIEQGPSFAGHCQKYDHDQSQQGEVQEADHHYCSSDGSAG